MKAGLFRTPFLHFFGRPGFLFTIVLGGLCLAAGCAAPDPPAEKEPTAAPAPVATVPASAPEELEELTGIPTLDLIQGEWRYEDDPLGGMNVQERNWTWAFEHPDYEPEETQTFRIHLTNKLPQYVNPEVETEFILLVQGIDTMRYEIMGLTDSTLSLMYYPRGNIHIFKRKPSENT